MKKYIKYTIIILAFVSGLYALITSITSRTVDMKQFISFSNAEGGKSIVSWYEDDDIYIARINNKGKIEKYISFDSMKGEQMYTIESLGAGENESVFALRNVVDAFTGETKSQELMVIDFNALFSRTKKIIPLQEENDNYTYGFMNVSGETITLISTDPFESTAIRKNYEYGSIYSGVLNIKNERTYKLAENEGIYQAIGNGQDLIYISDSGKIFRCVEEDQSVQEIYPARTLETLLYPTFLAYAESGYVYFGEHESGNISKLDILTGQEEIILNGNSTFNGSALYTPKDIVKMSLTNISNYTAVVQNTHTNDYNFLITQDGVTETVEQITYLFYILVVRFLLQWLIAFVGLMLVYGIVELFIQSVKNGRTVMSRLLAATLPLIIFAMMIFGLIAFGYYKESIQTNFEKQTEDEGNMLTALFGQESFQEIMYPYDYTSEAYHYLLDQLKTRDLYSRVIYYESGDLYVAVDENSPCFYPFGINLNMDAQDLFMKAALTGQAVKGTIVDDLGERLVCITPVGGVSGDIVYLLETGIYVSNIDTYVQSYLGRFSIVCIVFLILTIIVLSILYYRILFPLNEVKWVMGQFTEGNTNARIEITSEDEVASISRIFNNMADDMMLQIHNLQKMGETYYRFVPVSVISLLGMNNLGELSLGSKIVGSYPVLKVELKLPHAQSDEYVERQTNRFFNTINNFARMNEIVPIVDDSNLSSIMLICQKGVDSAIIAALSILARVDSDNTLLPKEEAINLTLVLHQTEVNFGICGDEDRYVLALFAPEFPKLMKNGRFFDASGCRLMVTEVAYEQLHNKDAYANRFIGNAHIDGKNIGMYDIYDDRNADEINKIKSTQRLFIKAMELYLADSYYEAKNLFAMVLRENPNDRVAKYYIFQCEELQKKN